MSFIMFPTGPHQLDLTAGIVTQNLSVFPVLPSDMISGVTLPQLGTPEAPFFHTPQQFGMDLPSDAQSDSDVESGGV